MQKENLKIQTMSIFEFFVLLFFSYMCRMTYLQILAYSRRPNFVQKSCMCDAKKNICFKKWGITNDTVLKKILWHNFSHKNGVPVALASTHLPLLRSFLQIFDTHKKKPSEQKNNTCVLNLNNFYIIFVFSSSAKYNHIFFFAHSM